MSLTIAFRSLPMPWTYPSIMVLAVAAGIVLSLKTQRSLGLTGWQRLGIAVGAFCGAGGVA